MHIPSFQRCLQLDVAILLLGLRFHFKISGRRSLTYVSSGYEVVSQARRRTREWTGDE